MANITNQATLDALRSATDATYIDTDAGGTEIQGTVVMRPGYMMITEALAATNTGTADFTADDTIINVTSVQSGNGGQFNKGAFSSVGGQTVYTHTTGNKQWPGWTAIAGQDRPTFNMQNHTVRSPNGGQVTNHFGCMATSGNNFSGFDMQAGALYLPIGAVTLNNVTFSPTAADDSGTGPVRQTYARIQFFTGGNVPQVTASFFGMYGCDMTSWTVIADRATASNCISMNIRKADHWTPSGTTIVPGNTDTNGTMLAFLIDNNYSQTILDNGFSFESGDNGGNLNMSLRLITGESWAPQWLDDLNGTPVADLIINFGNRTIWTPKTAGDTTGNIPVETSSDGTNNYLPNYVSGTKRTGYLLETNRGLSQTTLDQQVLAVTQATSITNIPYWSYTHECFDASGNVTMRNSTASTITGEFEYSQTELDTTAIASEGALLNNKTLAEATELIDNDSLSTLDELYSVLKALSYNDREETISYRVVGSKLSMMGSNWQLYNGSTILESFRTRVGCASELSGGSLFDGLNGNVFTASTPKALSDMSLQFTTFNMNNVTLGAGITLDGGSFNDTLVTMSDLTFINQPVFQLADGQTYTFNDDVGDFTLNLASGAATVNITGSTLTPTLTGGGTITIPVASTTTTFVVGADKPSGRVILKLRGSAIGTNVIDTTHTSSVKTTLSTFTNDTTSSAIYDIYYQPTNTFGANGEFFITSKISSSISGTIDKEVDITSAQHADVLTTAAENADLTGITATMSNPGTGTTSNIAIGGTDTTTADAPQSQAILLRVVDDVFYLNLMANAESDIDFLLPLIQSGTSVNQKHFTLTSSDNEQQGITAASGTDTGTLVGTITTGGSPATIRAVNITPNSAGISGPEVESAVRPLTDAIETKVDSTKTVVDSTENRVADIADKDETLPGPFKKAAYNPDTDYKT